MRAIPRLAIAASVAACLLHAERAWAPFHVVVVDQVFFGTADCPNAQYVMMRMLASSMQFINGQKVRAQNADGSAAPDFGTFNGNAPHGMAGDAFIMGTSDAAALFGIAMDQETSGMLVRPDGRVCYGFFGSGPVDCVAYGNYTGDNTGGGSPAVAAQFGMALIRESGGQLGNDATDFALGAPMPRNNAGDVGTLGQCGAAVTATSTPAITPPTATAPPNTPTAILAATPSSTSTAPPATSTASPEGTSTQTATAVPSGTVAACVGDCGGDGMVDISDLVLGVNIALGNSPISACAAFACQGDSTVPINCLVSAVNNALNGCPATPTAQPLATRTPLPTGALGVRRFSINPDKSQFIAVLAPGAAFPSSGFQGFIQLTAGPLNNGLAFVDVTDASDYLSVDVPAAGTAVCLKILRDQLPIHNAGVLSCNGGVALGIDVTQDHNIGVVGHCSGGANAGQACGADGDCPDGTCFTAAICTAMGGTVEGPERPHPGVCNGPFVGQQGTDPSPAGTLVIAPDPHGFVKGIPIEFSQEGATPCGDEGVVGTPLAIGFTTGRSVSHILNFNNEAGATLSGELTGVPFSCDAWTTEDGPGTLVLSAANLDTQIAPGSMADIVAQFQLAD
jgi:hypothetical protein